jgi:hypothetical protein
MPDTTKSLPWFTLSGEIVAQELSVEPTQGLSTAEVGEIVRLLLRLTTKELE